jgi:dihydroorotate dehydrogenase
VYGAIRNALFRLDPERAHHVASILLRRAQGRGPVRALLQVPKPDRRLSNSVFGIDFESPLGIAAGFDKEAHTYNALLAIGFGHVEIGTVTPRGQPGNDKPRIQRFPEAHALVNRMGFPGPGADAIDVQINQHEPIGPIGINIGPNKGTAPGDVAGSLHGLAHRLARHADYLAINISSPNTPGLRNLQTPDAVADLVTKTLEGADDAGQKRPVLLKVHPDSPEPQVLEVARAAAKAGAAGIIAVNTTKDRAKNMHDSIEGGMSGAPLLKRATSMVAHLHHGLGRDTPIIGVGGVIDGADAYQLICAGASLVQTYTGFIYGGPRMPVLVQAELVECLNHAGLDAIADAVGSSSP